MAAVVWSGFRGENRAMHPMMLAEGMGTASSNQKIGRGDFRPWRQPAPVASVPIGRRSIYRMGRDVPSDSNYWLSWTGRVHAVRGFDPDDTTERTYYSGDGAPKVTDNLMALAAPPYPTTSRPLGIAAPQTAILASTITDPNATGDAITYYYVYTFVNDWGWESAPSGVSLVEHSRKQEETASLTGFAVPPNGNEHIDRIRIYRTQGGTSGNTDFFFLREVPIGTTSTIDDNRALAEPLATLKWLPAPSDLKGLTALWNGMLAGVSGNSVRFCEAYTPYAWPLDYDVVPPDATPVGLGVFNQSLLVLTTGRPLLVAGSSPESMDQQPIDLPYGCISADSIVSMGSGVAWASNDGLVWYGNGGARLLTAGLMLREDWLSLRPHTMIGQMYAGLYFGSYEPAAGQGRKGFLIDPHTDGLGIFFLDAGFDGVCFDSLQDQLYVLNGNAIGRWDGGVALMVATAKSKVFRQPEPTNFACAQVVGDGFPLTVTFYADGVLKHTQVVTNNAPFRLPSGFMATDWQMQVQGAGSVQLVAMAHSMAELKQI
jgi:hypothetical protein